MGRKVVPRFPTRDLGHLPAEQGVDLTPGVDHQRVDHFAGLVLAGMAPVSSLYCGIAVGDISRVELLPGRRHPAAEEFERQGVVRNRLPVLQSRSQPLAESDRDRVPKLPDRSAASPRP